MDYHAPHAITNGLRLREVDVLTAYEDGAGELDDPAPLDRAAELGRVLFTQDDDLLAEATSLFAVRCQPVWYTLYTVMILFGDFGGVRVR